MDLFKQIQYWQAGSDEDFEVAEEIMTKARYRHALFFAHLALEKILKAHVTMTTGEIPPRIHNLIRLSEIAALALNDPQREFLREFDEYQIEGRYPIVIPAAIDSKTARDDFMTAEEIRQWLKNQLSARLKST